MNNEIIFNNSLAVVDSNGEEIIYQYFMFQGTPIIEYNKKNYSFVTNFENQNWTSNTHPEFSNIDLIFLNVKNDPIINWCSIHHEMGHIINKHPILNGNRLELAKQGIVSKYELEADNNVLINMGLKNTEIWLKSLLKRLFKEIDMRKKYQDAGYLNLSGKENLEKLELSYKEVELRIEYINKER